MVATIHAGVGSDGINPVVADDAFGKSCHFMLLCIGGAEAGREVVAKEVVGVGIIVKMSGIILCNAPLSAEVRIFYQPVVAGFLISFGRLCVVDPVV